MQSSDEVLSVALFSLYLTYSVPMLLTLHPLINHSPFSFTSVQFPLLRSVRLVCSAMVSPVTVAVPSETWACGSSTKRTCSKVLNVPSKAPREGKALCRQSAVNRLEDLS